MIDFAQDERAFLEQEHDDRANILATRVVTTGGMMQVLLMLRPMLIAKPAAHVTVRCRYSAAATKKGDGMQPFP